MSFLSRLAKLFSSDVGVDLGTANCLVYVRDRGIVIDEPSVVAINGVTKRVEAVGDDAKRMLGRTPDAIQAIRPMKDGVIADFDVTETMLRCFISKAINTQPWYRRLLHPQVLVAVPSGITEVENRAVRDSAKRAGAAKVRIVEEPMAAAIGVGLPVSEPLGSMIVDVGGGTTEVAIISLIGVVASRSVRVGGDELDKAIIQHMSKAHNLHVGDRTAERIKMEIGSAYPIKDHETLDVRGRDLVAGMPKTVRISAEEIRIALQEPITTIVEAVRETLSRCPPELSGDLIEHGIMLAGGGALLCGLEKLISEETTLPVFVAEDPLRAVVNGTGIILQEMSDRDIF